MSGADTVEGDLKSFTIFDITQTLLAGRKSASVTIRSGPRLGTLYFLNGQIIHAVDDATNLGEKAVFAIFTWRRGTFSIDFDARVADKNVDKPTDYLLLEVARHLDETARDDGAADPDEAGDAAVSNAVEKRLDQKLRSQLNAAFKKVAMDAEPRRQRYARDGFDGLLKELAARQGSALLLRGRTQPRIKTPDGFATVNDKPVDDDELRGFLNSLLSESEKAELRERKEVATFYDAGDLGTFRVSAVEDEGSPFVSFSPSGRKVPAMEDYGLGLPGQALASAAEGLVLVGGPLGGGKSTFLASLVRGHLEQDRFVVLFSSGRRFAYSNASGAIIRRSMPAPGAPFAEAVRSAIEQEAEIIAIDGIPDRDALQTATAVARTGRLVLATIETLSTVETLLKLQALTQDAASGDRIGPILAEALRAIVDLPARRRGEPAAPNLWMMGRDEQAALQTNDFATLRRRRVSPKSALTDS